MNLLRDLQSPDLALLESARGIEDRGHFGWSGRRRIWSKHIQSGRPRAVLDLLRSSTLVEFQQSSLGFPRFHSLCIWWERRLFDGAIEEALFSGVQVEQKPCARRHSERFRPRPTPSNRSLVQVTKLKAEVRMRLKTLEATLSLSELNDRRTACLSSASNGYGYLIEVC